jgi:hypothetical protein
MFCHENRAVSVSHVGRRYLNGMRQPLSINGYMALDSRDFFAAILSLPLRRIRVFNALCVHYAEACFLAPTIAGTDLSNHFF